MTTPGSTTAAEARFAAPLTVAYVPSHLPSYYAEEYDVFARSRAGLERLADELDFTLLALDPVVTREEARRAAASAAEAGVDLTLLQNSTFAMGDVVLEFARQGLRLGLWAAPEPTRAGPIMLNSLVSMHLNAGVLRRYLRETRPPFKWFYGDVDHPWFGPRLAVTVRALRALRRLAGARIALVGGVAPTFFNVIVDERTVLERLGLEVVAHELDEVVSAAGSAGAAAVDAVVADLRRAGRVEVEERDLRLGAAVYLALRALALRGGYDALALSDWPRFQRDLGHHPGLAMTWLDEHDGVPVAAEGDVLGAATMLLMRALGGHGAALLDINEIDLERDALLLWHCGGSPLGLADGGGVRWTNHTTLGRKTDAPPMGAVADLTFAAGPATVARLADDGRALLALEAEIVPSPHPGYDGSRGWFGAFRSGDRALSAADVINTVMAEGVEHHVVAGRGHHGAALFELAAWGGLSLIAPRPYRDELRPGDLGAGGGR